MVAWAIDHELTHFVLLLRENQCNARQRVYVGRLMHHCDVEFKRVTRVSRT
jgi:hypothetical protein